jgi:hypothetical protein
MQVERLVRGDLLRVGDELDRLVHQVLGQVIPLLRGGRRLHLVVAIHQVRVPLAGVTTEEPVEPLELAAQRPAVKWPGAGLDSSVVRPITPGNALPGPYSSSAMQTSP